MVAPRAGRTGAPRACSCSTASPATRRRCAASPRRSPAAGYHVELPRLPGHGTTVEDMLTTGWADWSARSRRPTTARRAGRPRRRRRAQHGRLADAVAGPGPPRDRRPRVRQPGDAAAAARGPRRCSTRLLDDGTEVMPGIGSDIADPDGHESAYDGTPVAAAAVVPRRRPGADRGPLRRADDAAAAVHVARRTTSSSPTHSEHLAEQLRRAGRPPLARAQLPRRHPGLRPRRHLRRRPSTFARHGVTGIADAWPPPASIPSPSSGTLDIGPLSLNAYGLMIALGVIAARLAVRPAARGRRASAPATTPTPSPSGASSPASSAPGCTT